MDFTNSKRYKELKVEFSLIADSLRPLFKNHINKHGLNHTRRVYILVNLIADYEKITENYRKILSYCALYHDIGRVNDRVTPFHGKDSFKKIIDNNLISNDYEYKNTVKFIIENHCIDDDLGIKGINSYNIGDKDTAIYLYKAFKDADNLDRVRIGDFDINYLRLNNSKKMVNTAWDLYYKKFLEVMHFEIDSYNNPEKY